jgi:hypothetical protein
MGPNGKLKNDDRQVISSLLFIVFLMIVIAIILNL